METKPENASTDAAPLAPSSVSSRRSAEAAAAEATPPSSDPADVPKTPAPEDPPVAEPVPESKAEGHLTFDHSIVTEIAHREAQSIPGVVELSGSFIDGWMRGKSRGIKVEEHGEEAYTLKLNLIVEYGSNCAELFQITRNRISHAIKHMTGREVRRIDVHIAGIKSPSPKDEPPESFDSIGEEHGIDF